MKNAKQELMELLSTLGEGVVTKVEDNEAIKAFKVDLAEVDEATKEKLHKLLEESDATGGTIHEDGSVEMDQDFDPAFLLHLLEMVAEDVKEGGNITKMLEGLGLNATKMLADILNVPTNVVQTAEPIKMGFGDGSSIEVSFKADVYTQDQSEVGMMLLQVALTGIEEAFRKEKREAEEVTKAVRGIMSQVIDTTKILAPEMDDLDIYKTITKILKELI